MRRATLLVTALLLLASPVWAQQGGVKGNAFGSTICANDLPCAGGYGEGEVNIDSLAAASTRCVSDSFALPGSVQYFDTSRGMDSSRCLVTITSGKAGVLPRCCLVPQPGKSNTCMLSCQAVKTR